jgi:hypothetical protein
MNGKKITTEEFIKRAKKVHGDAYDYSKTNFIKSSEKVCITCKKHGDFWQLPFNHLKGQGCPKCKNENLSKKHKNTTEEFIKKAKKVHGNKYDYSETEYVDCKTKVCIICPKHGKFWQVPYYHLNGNGCQECAKKSTWDKRGRMTTENFIERARQVHGDKYDYSKVEYKNRRTKIKIICHKCYKNGVEHGIFYQNPYLHITGSGCPHCRNSYLESKIFKLLTENDISFEKEKTYEWLVNDGHMYLDFYLPKYNVGIECQGVQHYADIEIQGRKNYQYIHQNDLLKNKLCKENGIKIFYFTDKNMYDNYCKDKELTYYDFNSMINDIKNEFAS